MNPLILDLLLKVFKQSSAKNLNFLTPFEISDNFIVI